MCLIATSPPVPVTANKSVILLPVPAEAEDVDNPPPDATAIDPYEKKKSPPSDDSEDDSEDDLPIAKQPASPPLKGISLP